MTSTLQGVTWFPAQGLIDSLPSHDVPLTACGNGYDFIISDSTELSKRPGYEDINASAVSSSPSITSLMSLYLSSGTKYELAGCANGSVWRFDQVSGDAPTGTVTASPFIAGTFSTTQPIDFTQFLDIGVFLDGSVTAKTWDGTSSGQITAIPAASIGAPKYGELHLNKFFIAGIAGALSSVAYGQTGSLYGDYTGSGTGQFNVDQNDGSVVKGLKSFSSNELVISGGR